MAGAGLSLRSNPTALELWRAGLQMAADMTHPNDEAPVVELQPWLGSLALIAGRQGIETVGALKTTVAQGGKIKGMGPSSLERIAEYFWTNSNTRPARSTSVFNQLGYR